MVAGFDFADVYDEVVDRAGGEQSTASDVVRVRRGLRLLLERWEAKGFNTWRIRSLNTMSTGSGAEIQLPRCVDDVINVNALRMGKSESPMRRITAVEYAQLANKTIGGQPSQYWLDREAPSPALYVYPIGKAPIIVTYVERPADYDRFSDENLDSVPGRWLEALVAGLAHDLACKRPPYNEQLISRLKAYAVDAEEIAQDADRNRARFRYRKSGRRR